MSQTRESGKGKGAPVKGSFPQEEADKKAAALKRRKQHSHMRINAGALKKEDL